MILDATGAALRAALGEMEMAWTAQRCQGAHGAWRDQRYPPVNKQFAIENGPFIVDLPMKNGDFP